MAILRGLKERYEVHHGVRIKDSALVAAAVLSDRYVTGRFLPDKAIDLVDEAASRLRIEIDSMPTEVDVLERRARQLEIERAALRKETDQPSRERLAKLEEELASLQETLTGMKSHWEGEKEAIAAIREINARIEEVRAKPSGRPATGSWSGRPSCATASCPAWSVTWPRPTSAWPSCSPTAGCSRRRSTRRTWPRSCPPGPASP